MTMGQYNQLISEEIKNFYNIISEKDKEIEELIKANNRLKQYYLSAKITDIEKEYSDEWIEKNYDWIFRDNLKDMRDKIIERLKQ